MKFGVPWNMKGIGSEARKTAREAARRSGVSLEQWLDGVILQQAKHKAIEVHGHGGGAYRDEFASVNHRLDDLSRRIEQMTRSGPVAHAPQRGGSEFDKMEEMIGRLDRRFDQFATTLQPAAPPMASSMTSMQMPPSLDRAVAETAAHQRVLNAEPVPPRARTPITPLAVAAPSGLEDQLRRITDQIETLRQPDVEQAINALREELDEISRALNDVMPRRAIEAIEKQIAGLTQRIAEGRQAGVEHGAVASIEHGLAEVRDALRGLTPAENLVGFNEAVASLAHKIHMIVAQKDPATFQQLETAITTLRSIATHIASNETVRKLAAEVQVLGERVEQIAHVASGSTALDHLEQRINAFAEPLAERAQAGAAVPPHLEALMQTLTDKIDQIHSSRVDNVALGHLEDRIVKLVAKLDASESRLGQLEAVERGLSDLLVYIETSKQSPGLLGDSSPAVDELKHDIARTQDALDSLHGTLAIVVDRLAAIEQDIRGRRGDAPVMPPASKFAMRVVSTASDDPQRLPSATPMQMPPAQAAAPAPPAPPEPQRASHRHVAASLSINPDQPLEPGSGPPLLGANATARVAASEAVLGTAAPAFEPGGKSSFIAAARRAAQAAVQQAPATRATPTAQAAVPPLVPEQFDDGASPSLPDRLAKRGKSLLIAASIIAIVVGGAETGRNMLNLGGATKTGKTGKAESEQLTIAVDEPLNITSPNITSPNPLEREPIALPLAAPPAPVVPAPVATTPAFNFDQSAKDNSSLLSAPDLGPPPTEPKDDVTESIPPRAGGLAPVPDHLPLAIGGPHLRSAAASGDVGAAYEVALRFAEGRGVPVNLTEAAHWFERAASKGLAPAQFRYGSMLEKGQGAKKDLSQARQLYLAAAAKGNAKAMHNLAVLYAEGIDGKPDYGTAVKWFRQAAQRGIADSQFNLGVLSARGLGTEVNLAESYEWFALAAARGDAESAKKRDEVASRLDPAALATAQQAVKNFVSEPQPAEATAVPRPQGGWDNAVTDTAPEPALSSPKPKAHPQPAPHAPLSLGSFTDGKR